MRDRPKIIQLHAEGAPIRTISREEQVSRNAVRRAVAPDARTEYWRPNATEDFEPAVRDTLADYPHMTVADIALVVDWRKSRRTLSDLVAKLRPEYIERAESEATEDGNIQARPMDSLKAGSLGDTARLSVAVASSAAIKTLEVDWWTELKNATNA